MERSLLRVLKIVTTAQTCSEDSQQHGPEGANGCRNRSRKYILRKES